MGGNDIVKQMLKKIIIPLVFIFSLFYLVVPVHNIAYADPMNSVGSNLTASALDKNSDAFGNQSKAHEEQDKKNKGQNGKDDVEAGEWLQSHDKWIQFGTLMTWIGHQMGWGVIKGLYFISSYVEEAVTQILDFISGLFGGNLINQIFGDSTNSLFDGATALAWTVLGVAITYWGVKYVWYGEKRLELNGMILNVVLVALFLVSSSTIIDKTMEVGINTYKDVQSETTGNQPGGFSLQIVRNNVVDLKEALKNDNTNAVSNDDNQGYNNLNDAFVKMADMSEILTPKDIKEINNKSSMEKYLEYQISDVDSKGNISAKEIDNGWFDIFKAGYFRFGTRFFNIISELLIMAVAMALYGYLLIRNAIDLLFTKIIGGIAAAKDIERGEALRMVIIEIGRSALGIACTGISLCVFVHLFNGINNQDWNPVAHTIALLASAVACLDGASVFDRYFGIDIGLRSGWQAAVGAFAGAKTATSVASGAVKAAGAVTGGIVKGGTAIKNGVMDAIGSTNGLNDKEDQDSQNPFSSQKDTVMNGLENQQNEENKDPNTTESTNSPENNENKEAIQEDINGDEAQTDADGAVVANDGEENPDDMVDANIEGDAVDHTEDVDDLDNVEADNPDITSQEDDDINSLDQTDLEENQVDANDTALDNEQLNQNVDNEVNNQDNDVVNGVDGVDSEAVEGQMQDIENGISANEANDIDAGDLNRLEGEQMATMNQSMTDRAEVSNGEPVSSQVDAHLGTNAHQENQSIPASMNSSVDTSSAMNDSSNSGTNTPLYDNSTTAMNHLLNQSKTLNQNQSINLGAMTSQTTSRFDPTRRVTTNTHIQMPDVSNVNPTELSSHESDSGGTEPFDHTK